MALPVDSQLDIVLPVVEVGQVHSYGIARKIIQMH